MPTCSNIMDECSAMLHGFGSTQDRVTPLTSNIGPTDTTFTVDFAFGQAVGITPGVVEIDSEQLYVTAVDANTGVCTLANGFGRGYSGTTATAHTAGARVVSRPRFPRKWLFNQVNQVVGSLYPDIFSVKTYSTTVTYPSNTYTIPQFPFSVLDVQWQDPIGDWHKVFGYGVDDYDGTLRLGSGAMIGRPLRVLYGVEPSPFTAETDDYTVTGMPASCVDLLKLGVVANQIPGLDISRAQLSSVEQSDRSRTIPPNQGINASKYLMALYQERLRNEAQSLRRQYKPRMRRGF